jgi:hypothetical protein
MQMNQILDLDSYPIDKPESSAARALSDRCIADLARNGMFNLEGFVRAEVLAEAVREVRPAMDTASFTHRRMHNIYFKKDIPGLAPDHPALRKVETINHTVCGDQIPESIVRRVYEWPPLAAFLARVMHKPTLYPMADELAGANVMEYRAGEALNWHFDRSEFTTTLLLQAPLEGGGFEYRSDLRSEDDPNYAGVARLLEGRDGQAKLLTLAAGTLNVFRGKNTAHRVTTIQGERPRIVAVLSYYERPGAMFSAEERLGFYGRVA